MNDTSGQAKQAARDVHSSDTLDRVNRFGLLAFGLVHLVLGWLAVQLAFGDREGSTSTSGAVQELAEQPMGIVLVWLVAIGMVLYSLIQLVEAAIGRRDDDGTKRTLKRAISAGKAVVYGVIAFSALKVALGKGSGGGEQSTDSMTGKIMDLPGGQVLVGLIGLGILVTGGALVVKGVTDRFLDDIQGSGQRGADGTAYTWAGRIGYTAKGIAIGMIGLLFGYAAITHDPDKSGGLDQALTEVLDQPYGPVLIAALGLGLASFGGFCFAWARHLDR